LSRPKITTNKKITIVGAGLTGALLAVLLGRRGYEVEILERRPDPRLGSVDAGRSINLALSSRGIQAFEMAGLMDQVRSLLIPMRGRMLHLEDGSSKFSPYGSRPHEVIYSISRRDLNLLLINAAEAAEPVHVRFGQSLETVDFTNHSMTVVDPISGDGCQQEYEVLIGADGAGSRVRRSLISAVGGEATSELLDHEYKELEIPARKRLDGLEDGPPWSMEREALHIWPRGSYMLIALPNQDGSFTVTLFMPKETAPGTDGPSFQSLAQPKNLHRFFQVHFADAFELIPELEDDFYQHPQGLLGTIRCRPWHYGDSAVILGDASHAIVPFHGQGMNAGLEDCSELVRLLEKHRDDWGRTLTEFDAIRRPNANAIADMALENYMTMRKSVTDPQFHLKKNLGFKLEKCFPNRFVPRYSLVMFHLLPYRECAQRGKIQGQILAELVEGKQNLDEVDFELAERLVRERLVELPPS
jgi:kynurenine 3-monooxygenase